MLTQLATDVVIIGGGISGLATLFALVRYSGVRRIVLIERRKGPAKVNSHPRNNSQTLHRGCAESNYTLEQAAAVARDAAMVLGFVERFARGAGRQMPTHMIGVGAAEVADFRRRARDLCALFPDLRLLERADIALISPELIEGRDVNEPIVSFYSESGYAVDFEKLGERFLEMALEDAVRLGKTVTVAFDQEVTGLRFDETTRIFHLSGPGLSVLAKTLEIAAGNSSLLFARKLGLAKHFAMLPVAGSYFVTGPVVQAKVYGFQDREIPFAAAHADPDINDASAVRFGPTAMPVPLLERDSWASIWEFLRVGTLSLQGFLGILRVIARPRLLAFGLKNLLYELPLVGAYFFAVLAARKIVPTIRARDLRRVSGAGGIRGQLVDLSQGGCLLKVERIPIPPHIPANCIASPSPGASRCLGNAIESATRHAAWLGVAFRETEMRAELSGEQPPNAAA